MKSLVEIRNDKTPDKDQDLKLFLDVYVDAMRYRAVTSPDKLVACCWRVILRNIDESKVPKGRQYCDGIGIAMLYISSKDTLTGVVVTKDVSALPSYKTLSYDLLGFHKEVAEEKEAVKVTLLEMAADIPDVVIT